jgi:hypothetical protein
MKRVKTPDNIDLIVELTPQEWTEMGRRLEASSDLIFSNLFPTSGENYLARVGGAWILILLKENPESGKKGGDGDEQP